MAHYIFCYALWGEHNDIISAVTAAHSTSCIQLVAPLSAKKHLMSPLNANMKCWQEANLSHGNGANCKC